MTIKRVKLVVPTLPPGSYTGTLVRHRKVRNKPLTRLTFQIDEPKTVEVAFVELDIDSVVGKTVSFKR